MIKIYLTKNEIYIKKLDEVFYFKIYELEKELEDILDQSDIDKKEKIFLILDFEAEELEKYQEIFKYYGFRIKKAIKFVSVLQKLKEEIIQIGNNNSIKINENGNIEILDFKKDDGYDFEGIKTLNINRENIDEIFKMVDAVKVKNLMKFKFDEKIIILIISALIVFLSLTISNMMYKKSNIDKEILSFTNEKNKIINQKNKLNNEILEYEKILQGFSEKEDLRALVSRKEHYKKIQYLLALSNKGIRFTNIDYTNDKLILEGVSKSFDKINTELKDYKIEYLLSTDEGIEFKAIQMGSDKNE